MNMIKGSCGGMSEYGWYAYEENGLLVIGDSWPHEGGELWRGKYNGDDTPYMKQIKKEQVRLYNGIVKYFSNADHFNDAKNLRNRLIAFLENKGFKHNDYYTDEDKANDVFFKDVDGIEFIYLLVYPHEGTKNRIMLRADAVENHDRWSNCDFQRFYVDEEDFKKNWNKYLIFDDEWCN